MSDPSWMKRQRLSVQTVAAHLARIGHGDAIAPVLAKAQDLEAKRIALATSFRTSMMVRQRQERLRDLERPD